ncbi:MAG: GNAT family N-acetyltransferase [Chloroflexota bacterium]
MDLTFHPLTPGRFADFERLFGPRGACGGCWCMFWKLRGKAFEQACGETARQMQKSVVDSGTVPGLLAYADEAAVGWCAVEPRRQYPRLANSRVLKPVDEQEVWSVTCFFTDKNFRNKGVTVALLRAAIEYVKSRGGKIVEGYPIDAKGRSPAPFVYTGLVSAFRQAGFVEAARNSPTRPIFRYFIS